MPFLKQTKPPLTDAISMVGGAVHIANDYLRDRDYVPSDDELQMFDKFAAALWLHYTTAQYIARVMHQRAESV